MGDERSKKRVVYAILIIFLILVALQVALFAILSLRWAFFIILILIDVAMMVALIYYARQRIQEIEGEDDVVNNY